jgi:hypothetical protein
MEYAEVIVDFSVYAFSEQYEFVAALIGDEVTISCLLVDDRSAYMMYYINGTQTTDVTPSVGSSFIEGDLSYIWLSWELGPMNFSEIGVYTCESYVNRELVVNMTVDLIGFSLIYPPAILTANETEDVKCTYDGPEASNMTWYIVCALHIFSLISCQNGRRVY